jgi:hypothetical protein
MNKIIQLNCRSILFLLMLCAGYGANAQGEKKVMVNKVDINALPDIQYIQLLGVDEGQKLMVEVDYGQTLSTAETIAGADGKPLQFETMISALNYMYKNGWEFINAYEAKTREGKLYHYILKRRNQN